MTKVEFSVEDFIEKKLKEQIEPLEKRLGIQIGFFGELLADRGGDWSFIIKLYALLEVAVAHYLSVKLNKIELQDTFLRLDFVNKYTGQRAFLKSLGLLDDYISYICAIAHIRNDYAHDISNVTLKFEAYFKRKLVRIHIRNSRLLFENNFQKLR